MVQGCVYLITGGSSGLGRATTELVLSDGGCVTIIDIQEPLNYNALKKYGDQLLFQQVDVTDEKGVADAIDATKKKFGKINVVVNCAGILLFKPIYDFTTNQPHSLQEFAKVINVNLTGTFNVVRLAIPVLVENQPNGDGQRGIIINTSSVVGHQGMSDSIAYSASKAAVMSLSYPLAKGLADHGIRVVDIAPGVMDTPMIAPYDMPDIAVFPKRLGKPIEFAKFVKVITENALLNGTSLSLDAASRVI